LCSYSKKTHKSASAVFLSNFFSATDKKENPKCFPIEKGLFENIICRKYRLKGTLKVLRDERHE
jgi:hypothetical protein